jgi:hypothetical protein
MSDQNANVQMSENQKSVETSYTQGEKKLLEWMKYYDGLIKINNNELHSINNKLWFFVILVVLSIVMSIIIGVFGALVS